VSVFRRAATIELAASIWPRFSWDISCAISRVHDTGDMVT
jgi:hypothetical protein